MVLAWRQLRHFKKGLVEVPTLGLAQALSIIYVSAPLDAPHTHTRFAQVKALSASLLMTGCVAAAGFYALKAAGLVSADTAGLPPMQEAWRLLIGPPASHRVSGERSLVWRKGACVCACEKGWRA